MPNSSSDFHSPTLEVIRCGKDSCSTSTSANLLPLMRGSGPENVPDDLADPAVTIGADGYPLIVHRVLSSPGDPTSFVAGVHCANPYCVPFYREH